MASKDLRTQINLSEEDLSEKAKEQFGSHGEIRSVYEMCAREILGNKSLSPVGRHLLCVILEENFQRYKNVINYAADHPELAKTDSSPPPLIICGLPRTGTTLLYNLLACDPACRATLLPEMLKPIPPLARSDTRAQVERGHVLHDYLNMYSELGLTSYLQECRASHPSFLYEEDLPILMQAGLNFMCYYSAQNNQSEFVQWFLDERNKDCIYTYHKTFIQMLNSVDAPQSHWLLKSPLHTLYLETLLRYYPTAMLVVTHRRLDQVLPSSCRLTMPYVQTYLDNNSNNAADNINAMVQLRLLLTDTYTRRLIDFHRSEPDAPTLDLLYEDLVATPVETIRRIYEHFQLTWSDDFEQAMLMWLRENPQGKQGRNTYTMDDFGLKHEEIEKRYEEYNTLFLKSHD